MIHAVLTSIYFIYQNKIVLVVFVTSCCSFCEISILCFLLLFVFDSNVIRGLTQSKKNKNNKFKKKQNKTKTLVFI